MASFEQHIAQARCNLDFLEKINAHGDNFIDWQVTTNFYIAVHLINSFLAKEANMHFASHELVKDAINPFGKVDKTKLAEREYLAYVNLRNLSRRSRYLLYHDKPTNQIDQAHFIQEKHFLQSFKYLDILLNFINQKYSEQFKTVTIKFDYSQNPPNLVNFKFSRRTIVAASA